MTLEQPGLGSDPLNGSGRERGATSCTRLDIAYLVSKLSSYMSNPGVKH